FFFQAEDGIRAFHVTGVQTCPLPIYKHRIEKVLVVNEKFELRGLITVQDINKAERYPNACKDPEGRLRVGASVGTSPDTDERVAIGRASCRERGGWSECRRGVNGDAK